MRSRLKIGVFDSGIGGLTVLKKLMEAFPEGVSLHYFADTARVPYGSKPVETLRRYVREIFNLFAHLDVDAIVTACNTSDSILTQNDKSELSVPYFSIIDPTVRRIGESAPNNSKVAIIATENTVKKSLYLRKLFRYESFSEILQRACPLFVPLIEEGIWEGEIVDSIVKYYLNDFAETEPDFLILGCTHYPFIKNSIEKFLPSKTKVVDPSEYIVRDVADWATVLSHEPSTVDYYVSGNIKFFQDILKRYLGRFENVKGVDLNVTGITVRERV
ncbi:MAG: glutamate racemase [Kosmotogaceae bacterium]|nr:glutamate racemase [Kosmotogaceae bacterium]